MNTHVCNASKVSCEVCGAPQASIWSLNNHKLKEHAPYPQAYCIECGVQFVRQDDLSSHVCPDGDARDGSTVMYSCSICGLTSASAKELGEHIAVHAGSTLTLTSMNGEDGEVGESYAVTLSSGNISVQKVTVHIFQPKDVSSTPRAFCLSEGGQSGKRFLRFGRFTGKPVREG